MSAPKYITCMLLFHTKYERNILFLNLKPDCLVQNKSVRPEKDEFQPEDFYTYRLSLPTKAPRPTACTDTINSTRKLG